jgi:hypothetical protein
MSKVQLVQELKSLFTSLDVNKIMDSADRNYMIVNRKRLMEMDNDKLAKRSSKEGLEFMIRLFSKYQKEENKTTNVTHFYEQAKNMVEYFHWLEITNGWNMSDTVYLRMAEQEIEGLNIEICDSETNQVIDMVKEDIQEILLWLESNELIEY